jgi:hypothetical protein
LQRFLSEVVLPPGVLPLADLRTALAKGAADVVFGWLREQRGAGWEAVEHRLREAGQRVATPEPAQWTEEGVRAIARVGEALQEPREGSPCDSDSIGGEGRATPRLEPSYARSAGGQ